MIPLRFCFHCYIQIYTWFISMDESLTLCFSLISFSAFIPRSWFQYCWRNRQPAHPRRQQHLHHKDHWGRSGTKGWTSADRRSTSGGKISPAHIVYLIIFAVEWIYKVYKVISLCHKEYITGECLWSGVQYDWFKLVQTRTPVWPRAQSNWEGCDMVINVIISRH